MKPEIIILTGTDCTGKTTIKKEIEKQSNYRYVVIDRFTDSIVYDELYNRPDRSEMFFKLEEDLMKIATVKLIYLDCQGSMQLKRLKDKNESEDIISTILKAKQLFEKYLNKTSLSKLIVNTTLITSAKAATRILEAIE